MQFMKIILKPVGIVRNGITDRHKMPYEGVDSDIYIYPCFRKALKGLNKHSDILVISYLHKAKKNVLIARRRRKIPIDKVYRGVFSVRSPDRPNPIAISKVKLVKSLKGIIKVNGLDVIGGTPILDIKNVQ
ncbi:MAG: S-adenosyl-L-methionine-binding protein [Elusimicrobia bacterium ADurb.Bin231]|nr:MAG: S-adenosyl-L-methionine-binding protein [Elusimicrobia bacterium ADurb.Bin231]